MYIVVVKDRKQNTIFTEEWHTKQAAIKWIKEYAYNASKYPNIDLLKKESVFIAKNPALPHVQYDINDLGEIYPCVP